MPCCYGMGCAPSIQVSHTGIIYCNRKPSDEQDSTPRSSVSANHVPRTGSLTPTAAG
ncbi:3'5'-cyclic nucleotide phosphodiesterase PDE8, partial [Trinorchestia longiramus]